MSGYAASAAAQFATVLIIARGLPANEAGSVLICIALLSLLATCATLGADTGLVRFGVAVFPDVTPSSQRALLLAALAPVALLGAALGAIAWVAAPQICAVLVNGHDSEFATEFLRWSAPFIPLSALTAALLGAHRGTGSLSTYVISQNISIPLGRCLLMAGCLALGASPAALGAAWGLPVCAALWIAIAKPVTSTFEPSSNARQVSHADAARTFWRFTGPRSLSAATSAILLWSDVLLVGALASPQEAAIYAAASRLAVLGAAALEAAGMAFSPLFARAIKSGHSAQLQRFFRTTTLWAVSVGWPFYLVLGLYPDAVLKLFGTEYEGGSGALRWLAVAGLANVATGNVTILLLMAGQSGLQLLNAVLATIVDLLLALALIPDHGATGAAAAWCIAILLNNAFATYQVRSHLGVLPWSHDLLSVAAGAVLVFSLPAAVIALTSRSVSVWQSVALLVATTAIYGVGVLSYWNRQRTSTMA